MQENEQFKRHTAFKLRVGDILMGKPVMNGDRFSFLELGNKNIVRVNVVGNIVDKYESSSESKYVNLTLDDGSGQIKIKTFGEDSDRFSRFSQGQTVVIIGTLRFWNNELYIAPELIKEQDPRYLLVRKLELEKEKSKNKDPLGRDEIIAVKDRILRAIKNAEEEGGIEKDLLIMNLKDISPHIINQEVQKMLEEGIIFEPRPGKVRYLG
jgi:RecG-like helicase